MSNKKLISHNGQTRAQNKSKMQKKHKKNKEIKTYTNALYKDKNTPNIIYSQ